MSSDHIPATQVTTKSSLKSTSPNRYYFTYPQPRSQNTCSSSNNSAKHSLKPNFKTRTVRDATYCSISPPSPSLSSSSSNTAYSESNPIFHDPWYCKLCNWIRILIIMVLLATVTIGIIFNHLTLHYCQTFLQWMDDYPIKGSFAFIGVLIACSVMMVPGSILTLGAGFVYVNMFGAIKGVIVGSTVVWFGATIGATLAFINGRYLFRNCVEYHTAKSSKFALIDSIIGMNGFKVTFLLRLSPITPYNVFNYLMGLTSVKLCDYMCACVGMIPDAIVYCFIGGDIASIANLSSVGLSHPALLIVTIVGTIVALAGLCYVTYAAKKEFDKMAFESSMSLDVGGENRKNKNRNDSERFVSINDIVSSSPYAELAHDRPNSIDTSMSDIALIGAGSLEKHESKDSPTQSV